MRKNADREFPGKRRVKLQIFLLPRGAQRVILPVLNCQRTISTLLSSAMLLAVLLPLVFSLGYGFQRIRMRKMEVIEKAAKTLVVLPVGNKALERGDEFYYGSDKFDVYSVTVKGTTQYITCVNDRLERRLEQALERSGNSEHDARSFKLFLKEFQPLQAMRIAGPGWKETYHYSGFRAFLPDPGMRACFRPPERIS